MCNISRFVVFVLAALASTAAAAQSTVLEELVVTAQKREQLVSDVGIAVTAFSGAKMEELGFEESTDIIAYSPGVSLAGDIGGQRAIFNIRGVVQNDYADLAEAPVAVYVDGGYLASTQAQTFGLFDVERMEVVKGPQGTLFGRNATGGMVNTVTAKPTDTWEGYGEITGARFGQVRVEAAMGGPLTDGVRGRLSFMTNQQSEIYDNLYDGTDFQGTAGTPGGGEDTWNDDTIAVRAQLELDIGERGNLLLIGNVADTTKSEGPYQVRATTEVRNANGEAVDVIRAADDPLNCDIVQLQNGIVDPEGDILQVIQANGACIDANGDGVATRPRPGGDFWGNIGPSGQNRDVDKDFAFDDQNDIESEGAMAKLTYDFDWATFTSISDYKHFSRVVGLDSDQTPRALLIFQSDGDIDQFSQELQLSGVTDRMNWVVGFYYLLIRTDFTQGLAESAAGVDDFALLGAEANTVTELDTDSFSVFGQVDYRLTDTLTLVGGLRLIQENKDFEGVVSIFANNDDRRIETDNLFVTLESLEEDNDQFMWSGKAQIEYSPTDDSLYYFGVNRGVKAGSFNAPLFGGLSPYDEETLWAFEVGTKLTVLDGRAQVNASAYYYDYNDYQSFSFRNNTSAVTNEQANYKGAELEILANPVPALDASLGVSYVDAEVEDLQITSDITRDTAPPFTPEWQVAGLLRYTWNDVLAGSLSAQVNASWKSEFFFESRNFSFHEFDSAFIADARLRWADRSGKWEVAAFLDNFTDERNSVIGFDVSGFYGTSQESFSRPRSYGIQVRRNFF